MTDNSILIDEDAESWINLMYCRDAAKRNPALRKVFIERLAPDVLKAADECTDYEDFKRRLAQYRPAAENYVADAASGSTEGR